jgi:hypothetical protein
MPISRATIGLVLRTSRLNLAGSGLNKPIAASLKSATTSQEARIVGELARIARKQTKNSTHNKAFRAIHNAAYDKAQVLPPEQNIFKRLWLQFRLNRIELVQNGSTMTGRPQPLTIASVSPGRAR